MTIFTLSARTARSGSFTTPDVLVPGGFTNWELRTDMNATDLADPTKSLILSMESSVDGGATWTFFAGLTWTGIAGTNPKGQPYPNPGLSGAMADIVGKRVRATGALNSSIRTGFVVELT